MVSKEGRWDSHPMGRVGQSSCGTEGRGLLRAEEGVLALIPLLSLQELSGLSSGCSCSLARFIPGIFNLGVVLLIN